MNGDEQAIEIPPATPRVTAMLPCETGADRMKVCRSCGQEKPVNAFWKKSRYEYQSQCIECMSEQRRIAREKGGLAGKGSKRGPLPVGPRPPADPRLCAQDRTLPAHAEAQYVILPSAV